MAKTRVIVYWLIPAEPYRNLFRDFIAILARELDAPEFAPHVTLCPAATAQAARRILRKLTAGPVRLTVRGVACSQKFTETLFVRFAPNDRLRSLMKKVAGETAPPKDPHLSLIYKKLPMATKRELAENIRLSFRHVIFDSVKAVSCVSPTETAADVARWRVIATKQLVRQGSPLARSVRHRPKR